MLSYVKNEEGEISLSPAATLSFALACLLCMSDAWRLVTRCQLVPGAMGAVVVAAGSDGVDLQFGVAEQTESFAI